MTRQPKRLQTQPLPPLHRLQPVTYRLLPLLPKMSQSICFSRQPRRQDQEAVVVALDVLLPVLLAQLQAWPQGLVVLLPAVISTFCGIMHSSNSYDKSFSSNHRC